MTAGKRADLTHIHGNLPTRIAVLSLSRLSLGQQQRRLGTLGEEQRRRYRDGVGGEAGATAMGSAALGGTSKGRTDRESARRTLSESRCFAEMG